MHHDSLSEIWHVIMRNHGKGPKTAPNRLARKTVRWTYLLTVQSGNYVKAQLPQNQGSLLKRHNYDGMAYDLCVYI